MLQTQTIETIVDAKFAKKIRVAIVRTTYYNDLLDNLQKHALQTLTEQGVLPNNIDIFTAPGSWEIPLVAQKAAKSKHYDAIIAFGIIVKGETYHFEMIANECARALMQLSLDYSMPVALEVLAVYKKSQAIERASDDAKNKGREAAMAVIKSLQTLSTIEKK